MSDWYKMNPVDWNEGTNGLTLEQEAAFLRICNAIYIAGGPISDNAFVVAGLLRCNDRKAKRLLCELVEAGKVTVEDGSISNRRAIEEVSARSRLSVERQSAGSRGGVESAKARSKPLKNKDMGQAIASTENQPEKIREEERRYTPSGAAPVMREISEAEVFRFGKALLGKTAGGVITNLKKVCGHDLRMAADYLRQASEKENPMEWLQRVIRASSPEERAYRGVEGVKQYQVETPEDRRWKEQEKRIYAGVL